MNVEPVRFQPIPTERLWGGHAMKPWFQADGIDAPIGEYWLVSGHPSATSVVASGPFAGMTLRELTEQYPEAYLGKSPQPRFPLLIKLIEARTDLSVQVHPDDTYAKEHEGDFGKTEAWYIVGVPGEERDRKVVYGHSFPDRQAYFDAVQEGRVRDHLHYRNIAEGDTVFVPARTLHAILGGTTLIEVQQTSDVTYRVYDWDRVDGDGNPRELHVGKAADVLDYTRDGIAGAANGRAGDNVRHTENAQGERLVDCPYFRIERLSLPVGDRSAVTRHTGPSVLVGVSGKGRLIWNARSRDERDTAIGLGHAWLVPSQMEVSLIADSDGPLTLLRVTY